jgi:ketosteroid isomerase-like protein
VAAGAHAAAVARTDRAARRGRAPIDRLLLAFPRIIPLLNRLTVRLPPLAARLWLVDMAARRAYAAYNRRDWAMNTLYMAHDDYVFSSSGDSLLPDAGQTFRGVEGYLDAQAEWLGAWSDLRAYSEGAIEIRRGLYLSLLRCRGSGGTSGIPVDLRCAALVELRDGKFVRQVHYWNRDDALAEFGVAEPSSPGRGIAGHKRSG